MSTFKDNSYCWRETYIIMLLPQNRPTTDEILSALQKLRNTHEIKNINRDTNPLFNFLTIISSNDSAAIDIVYHEGDHVVQEFTALADELERHPITAKERKKITSAREYSAKIELLHFEQIGEKITSDISSPTKLKFPHYSNFTKNLQQSTEDDLDEFDLVERLDPNTLIQVLKLVVRLTHGIAFDPSSGVVL